MAAASDSTPAPAWRDTRARRAVEAHIEELIALLDLIDGDPDLEASEGTETSLGWQNEGPQICLRSSFDDQEGCFA